MATNSCTIKISLYIHDSIFAIQCTYMMNLVICYSSYMVEDIVHKYKAKKKKRLSVMYKIIPYNLEQVNTGAYTVFKIHNSLLIK